MLSVFLYCNFRSRNVPPFISTTYRQNTPIQSEIMDLIRGDIQNLEEMWNLLFFRGKARWVDRSVRHAESRAKMLRNQGYRILVPVRVLLRQILHRFHQQPLPFQVARISLPRRPFTTRWIGHFRFDRERKNLGHPDTSTQIIQMPPPTLALYCRPSIESGNCLLLRIIFVFIRLLVILLRRIRSCH
jgi:hypothetical protein